MKIKTLLVWSLASLGGLLAAAPAPKALKVLMVGNSFSICVQKEMPAVAQALGLDLDLASLYIGGCSLERHAQNIAAATNAAFRPYHFTRFVRGVEQPARPINIPEALTLDNWDVVTLQQASHLSWKGETYRPFADEIIKTIKKLAPRAEIVIQETWSYTPWDKRLKKWGLDQHQMYAKLHRAYYDFAASKGLRVIPMGTAVQLYRARLPVGYTANSLGGDVVGSAHFVQDSAGVWIPKGDVFHLGPRGNYLQGLVWTAKLFGLDVSRCPYVPGGITPAEADCMKACAQAAVHGELPPVAFGGTALPSAIATGRARLAAHGVTDGEIVELDYRPNRLRVAYVLRPSPVSYIRCELALPDPDKWNGRFKGYGNGGWAGSVGCPGGASAVECSTDLGTSRYRIDENPVPLDIMKDFGWRATHLMTVEAKKLVQLYYGRLPAYCYFSGASTGGGQALCEAQRFPADYDGIIAEVPGNDRVPRAAQLWQLERLRAKYGLWFTSEEQKTIKAAELAFFAKTDPEWARGKYIVDPRPTPAKLLGCWQEVLQRNPALANREQLWRELFAPITIAGRPVSAGPVIGVEFTPPWTFTLEKFLGPRKAKDLTEREMLFFLDEPNQRFVDPDLTAFRARGGKIIMYAGLEDVSVPALPVCAYYDAVCARMGGVSATQEFFLHFLEPGRSHGTNARYGAHTLGSPVLREVMEDWVEKGKKPTSLTFNYAFDAKKSLSVTPYPEHKVSYREQ